MGMIGRRRGDDDSPLDRVGIKLGVGQREHAAHAGAGHGAQFFDAEPAQKEKLRPRHIA
jgi:hypothetical protein